jgi:hypothetical protein
MAVNRILTITALAILATGLANADMLITTDAATVGPTTTDFLFSLVFGATATPAGFHLVGATLSVTDVVTDTTLTLTNNASSSQGFDFTATSQADITSNSVDSTFVGSKTTPNVVLDTGSVTFASGQITSFGPLTLTSTLGPTAVVSAAGYLGGATIGGDTVSGTTFQGGGGNIHLDQDQSAIINGQLIFDFAPNSGPPPSIPEPASIILYGTALLGLGWFRKRRTN